MDSGPGRGLKPFMNGAEPAEGLAPNALAGAADAPRTAKKG